MDKVEDFFLKVLQLRPKDELQGYTGDFNKSQWNSLHELSLKSGLFPAFYKRLAELNLDGIPRDFISLLQNLYFTNLKRNIYLEKQMLEITAFFQKNGITLMPLKGPFMARQIYGDLDMRRTSCDLDFLVSWLQFKKAVSIFKNEGYYFPYQKDPDRHYIFRREVPLCKNKKDSVRLELHWDLLNIFSVTHIEEFWNSAEGVDYNGIKIPAPSSEDLLLYLIFKSVFELDTYIIDIKYLFDINSLILRRGDRINWKILTAKIRRFGFGLHAAYALGYSIDFFGTDIPKSFLDQFKVGRLKKFMLRNKTDKRNVLRANNKVKITYVWRFLTSSYLFSDNIFGTIKEIFRKIWLSVKLILNPQF